MRNFLFSILIQGFIIISFLPVSAPTSWAADTCNESVGKLVSLQGAAEVLREGTSSWLSAHMGEKFCRGDKLRVNRNARAAVVLNNEVILRINQKSTINFGEDSGEQFFLLKLLEGALHIFSHRPRALKVITPYVNGAVEGTEFFVQTGPDSSSITVFQGLVAASNEQGKLDVASGQAVTAKNGMAPQYMAVVRPRDAVQWTLYYPTIIDASAAKGERENMLAEASRSLSLGQVKEAQESISRILQKDRENSDAIALQAIIAVVNNDREQALTLASKALSLAPESAAAGLALSYAQQSHFDIEGALATLQKTAGFNPENAAVKARLAELLLSIGQSADALKTAQEAVNLAPDNNRAHTVLGFAYLTRIETELAQEAFRKAIILDSVLPLARLGLGLAYIRNGNLEEGRAEIEIAAALDPDKSLIRSYLGKAYFDERRDSQARRQYEIAKKLDPSDPTPWFYDAIRKQTVNQPVAALDDLRTSIALNNNRAVYRSRLLLDSDLAARSASLASIYSDLGFQQRALVEGLKSVNTDPTNYSAHRFLADSYSALPRHEIARVSELLQSQLLQPLSVTAVQPQLAESNMFILEGAGPAQTTFNEFNPLFLRNRTAFQASGVAGSNGIIGDELVLSGVQDNLSYSLGQFYYQTDGIRDNNDQDQRLYNGFFQAMLSPETSLMTEFRYRDDSYGDLTLRFDPTEYSETLHQDDETKSFRVGARHNLQPNSTLIGTAIISSNKNQAKAAGYFPVALDITNKADNIMAEVQHLYRGKTFSLQSGAGFLSADETGTIQFTSPFESFSEEDSRTQHANLYGYALVDMPHNITTTIGLSGDMSDSPIRDVNRLNPKLGITWQPQESTIVRGAAFSTMARRTIYAQTIEPTQVAGFNQFYDDFETATAWTYGVGVDQVFSGSWYCGLQFFHRDLEVPFTEIDFMGNQEVIEDDWQEDIGSAYLYWAPHHWVTLGLEYYYEDFSHDQKGGPMDIQNLTTHRLTPKLSFFHPSGFSARVQASFIDQSGDFLSGPFGSTPDSDQFWIVDLSLSYRLPERYGIISLEARNLFDEQFQYLDTDPASPRYLPEQQLVVSFTVAF